MNIFVKIGNDHEENSFFLEQLNGSPEELWLLDNLAAASKENGLIYFRYYEISDEDLEGFKNFYEARCLPNSLFSKVAEKYPKEKIIEWWKIVVDGREIV